MITMQSTANPYYLHTEQTRVYENMKGCKIDWENCSFLLC